MHFSYQIFYFKCISLKKTHILHFMYLFFVYVPEYTDMCDNMWRSKENLPESLFSFPHIDSEGQTWIRSDDSK